jgi:CDP-diacylglycerol--glycerol-3-phosphate 3-phosphatidyltransferase
VAVIVALAGATEVAGLAAVAIGASRRYDGPMGKSDRALVFGALGLALGLGVGGGRWLDAVFAAVVLLLAWTVVNRVRRALAESI